MKRFAQLYSELEQTTKTESKISSLVHYFEAVEEEDLIWAIALLTGKRPKRIIATSLLGALASEHTGLPHWLFDESFNVVGDLSETIALIFPTAKNVREESLKYWINFVKNLEKEKKEYQQTSILNAWNVLSSDQRYIFNKLVTGGFRSNVKSKILVAALTEFTGLEENVIAHRLNENWAPSRTSFSDHFLGESPIDTISKPYPFHTSEILTVDPRELGKPKDWQVERIWDGIRVQVIIRGSNLFIWSAEGELMTNKIPEVFPLKEMILEGTVIEGILLPFSNDKPLKNSVLQSRIKRKNLSKKLLETIPIVLMSYDLLEHKGKDIRNAPLTKRRKFLEDLIRQINQPFLKISPLMTKTKWTTLIKELNQSRAFLSKGLILKNGNSTYGKQENDGKWVLWKNDPLIIDAILLYAQRGQGVFSGKYIEYTFAVWEDDLLVPVAKTGIGLKEEDQIELAGFISKNTRERFGPVRSVVAELVFEIAFDDIDESTRHKSGVVLHNPRINSWKRELTIEKAGTLDDLKDFLKLYT